MCFSPEEEMMEQRLRKGEQRGEEKVQGEVGRTEGRRKGDEWEKKENRLGGVKQKHCS